jgi:hypothetical protein
MATSFLSPRVRALANRNIKVGLLGSDATAARHAASKLADSILGDDGPCRLIAIEVSSAGKLASCVQSRAGVCALPACIETATKVMARKPRAVSANTSIALYHTVAAARSTRRGRLGGMHFAFEVNRVNIRFTFLYNIACRHCYNRSGSRGRAHRIELERMLGIF